MSQIDHTQNRYADIVDVSTVPGIRISAWIHADGYVFETREDVRSTRIVEETLYTADSEEASCYRYADKERRPFVVDLKARTVYDRRSDMEYQLVSGELASTFADWRGNDYRVIEDSLGGFNRPRNEPIIEAATWRRIQG